MMHRDDVLEPIPKFLTKLIGTQFANDCKGYSAVIRYDIEENKISYYICQNFPDDVDTNYFKDRVIFETYEELSQAWEKLNKGEAND